MSEPTYLAEPPDLSDWLRSDLTPRPGLTQGSVLRAILLAESGEPACETT